MCLAAHVFNVGKSRIRPTAGGIQLKRFQEKHVPVLWRPLHEADAYKKLYRLMYDRFTNLHGLNNLIRVVNAPCEGWYPGDDVVD